MLDLALRRLRVTSLSQISPMLAAFVSTKVTYLAHSAEWRKTDCTAFTVNCAPTVNIPQARIAGE